MFHSGNVSDSCPMIKIASNSYSGIAIRHRVYGLLYSMSMTQYLLYSEREIHSRNKRHRVNMLYSASRIFALSEDC